jgi:short-subunit dehydrogenase
MADTVLVTGASSGIGLELATCFARGGSDLILVARSEDKLRQLARALALEHRINVGVVVSDLSRPDAVGELVAEIDRRGHDVDVLVNCAGFGDRGPFAEQASERQQAVIQVNVAALTELTRRLLPGMLQRRSGGVLNVASTAAFQPGPNMAIYFATKAFVLSFTEALAEEVRGSGVTVTCLAPGPTHTAFAEAADMLDIQLFKQGVMSAPEVAVAGYRGFQRGTVLVIPGLRNQLGSFAVRLTPRAIVTMITKRLLA